MNTAEEKRETNRPTSMDRRQDLKKIDIVEHGIRIQGDYGYIRAARYLFQNGIKWPVIQRVLHNRILRRQLRNRADENKTFH